MIAAHANHYGCGCLYSTLPFGINPFAGAYSKEKEGEKGERKCVISTIHCRIHVSRMSNIPSFLPVLVSLA